MQVKDVPLFLSCVVMSAILLWEAATLLTGSWTLTLSELAMRYPLIGHLVLTTFAVGWLWLFFHWMEGWMKRG